MGDAPKFDRDRSASAEAGSAASGRQTVLLSDLPDPAAATVVAEPSAKRRINLSPDALAALELRYEILGDAGSGSMGNVFKARDRETGGIVALKLLKPEIASDQQMMDRFKRELLFARKITHKNVCRVYEFNRANGVAYTSMEFVEGESLRAALNRERKLSAPRATEIGLQLCSGLKEAHAQGIVHRDLKPENVMLDAVGHVKIMDFGIARSMDAGTRLTGSLAGTPAYMAPEQVSGKPVDYRTDIYSVGLVLYEMFTGAPAFKAENSVAVALKQMSEEVAPPHTIEPTIPVSIERAILKCLEKEPERRYLSIAELEAALAAPATPRTIFPPAPVAAPAASARVSQSHSVPSRIEPVSTLRTAPAKSGSSPILWVLVGVGLAVLVLGGLRAAAKNAEANRAVFTERFATPAPPEFAYEIPIRESAPAPEASTTAALATAPLKVETPAKSDKPAPSTHAATAEKSAVRSEVFPKMETAPVHKRFENANGARSAAVTAVPNEYIWAGLYGTQDKARDRQKVVEKLLLPSSVVKKHAGKADYFALWIGPIKVARGSFDVQSLKAKGFLGAREISTAEYERAVEK